MHPPSPRARGQSGGHHCFSAQLGEQRPDAPAPDLELCLEPVELLAPAPHERELALDVGLRLIEDLAPARRVRVGVLPLVAARRARLLGLQQLAQLVERQAQQRLQPQRVAQAVDLLLAVEAMLAGSDESDLFRSAMSAEEAAQMAANWLAHLPAGRDGDDRWWPESLPRPTAKRGWS